MEAHDERTEIPGRQRTGISTLLGLLAISFLAGCSLKSDDRNPFEISRRLIEEEPTQVFSPEDFFDRRLEAEWNLSTEAEQRAWKVQLGSELGTNPQPPRKGLALGSATGTTTLARTTDFEAASIDVLELEILGALPHHIELSWTVAGGPLQEERKLLYVRDDAVERSELVSFDVATHPEWRGKIVELRLELRASPQAIAALAAIRGYDETVDTERLAKALAHGWKVDLDSEVRTAWLAVPGAPIECTLEITEQQALEFAYGLQSGVREPVDFSIQVLSGEEPPRTIFTERVAPEDAGRWLTAGIDLDEWSGREIGLRFATESESLLDLTRGLPVWGHPELLGPPSGELPPNVLIILLDTLRADRLSAYGYSRETSPNIDAWADHSGVLFENTIAPAPWTLPSHASLFTGQEALGHGINHYGALPPSLDLLPEMLRREGYATAAITGGGYLRPQFGFAQGFDFFRYWPRILAKNELSEGLDRTLTWLEENDNRPFFLFFHTYEIHYPHRRREPYFSLLADASSLAQPLTRIEMRPNGTAADHTWAGDRLVVQRPGSEDWADELTDDERMLAGAMYDSAIAYTDRHVARLLDHLKQRGLLDRTLVILTSDHGEALGENDLAGHNYLSEDNLRVPLIIDLPGERGAGQRVEAQTRSIDIMPTILEILDVEIPTVADGRSLVPLIDGDVQNWPDEAWSYASSANYGLALHVRNRWKYTFNNSAWSVLQGQEELFKISGPTETSWNEAQEEDLLPFRERARAFIEDHHRGYRVEIFHHGSGTLSGVLHGGWVNPQRVKAVSRNCECFRWEPGGGVRYVLRSGERATLYLEGASGAGLRITGGLELPDRTTWAPLQHHLSWEELGAGRVLAQEEDGWVWRDSADQGIQSGFRIWSTGDRADQALDPDENPDLVRQLRALGYAN